MAKAKSESSTTAPELLPLYDRRWVRIKDALAELEKSTSGVIAVRRLTERLRNGDIRSMVQRDYPDRSYGGPPAPERTQLGLFWESHEPVYSPGYQGPFFVLRRELVTHSLRNSAWDLQQQGFTFFVWGPDLKKSFGAEIADALQPPTRAQPRAEPDTQRKSGEGRQPLKREYEKPAREVGEAIIEGVCVKQGYTKGVLPKKYSANYFWGLMLDRENYWDPMCRKLVQDPQTVHPPAGPKIVEEWKSRVLLRLKIQYAGKGAKS